MTVIASETFDESVHHDRERIAAQLSDRVVRRLFTVVLGLQGAAGAVDDERERDTLLRLVREVDGAITQIRSIAFDLDDHGGVRCGAARGGGSAAHT